MTTPDLLYLSLIAIALLFDHFVLWRGFVQRSQTDAGRARLWLWSSWMILLWTLVAAGVALWLFEGRPWTALRFVWPEGWRLWGGVVLVVVLAIAQARTAVRIARTSRTKKVKLAYPEANALSPRTQNELGWWMALSLSAGFCEEFIFRGYLIWVFTPVLGLWGAAALSTVVFGLAHSYQGIKGFLATGAVGFLFALLVLISGSLWPAIALHAIVDAGQGLIAWLVLRRVEGQDSM